LPPQRQLARRCSCVQPRISANQGKRLRILSRTSPAPSRSWLPRSRTNCLRVSYRPAADPPWMKPAGRRAAALCWCGRRLEVDAPWCWRARLRSRRGPQKAICAVAASILTAIYHMLKSGLPYRDLGVDYFDRRSPEAKAKRLVTQLRQARLCGTTPTPRRSSLMFRSCYIAEVSC